MTRSLIATVLLLAATTVMADDVPLKNPGFELDEDRDGVPDGWRPFIHGEGFEIGVSDEVTHSGQRSARISAAPDHGSRACVLQVSPEVPVAAAYRLRLFVRGQGRPTGILRFRYRDAQGQDGDFTHHFDIEGVAPDEWAERTFELPPGKEVLALETTRIEVILYQRGTGDIYYDDVSIESLEKWTPKMGSSAQPRQAPRRPPDGKAVLQNPPDFMWPPEPTAEAYELQLSADEAFGEHTLTISDLPYNCYSHSGVLARTRWYWRYRYQDYAGNASEWSPVCHFEIAPDAVEFPVPPPAELLARIPRDHPRVYATSATLAEFRAPREGARAEWWDKFSARLEDYLTQDLPEEPGADYDFSRREGRLTSADMKRMNELRGLGSRATAPMWNLAFGYLVSGDERYAQAATQRLLAMAQWDPVRLPRLDLDGLSGHHLHRPGT